MRVIADLHIHSKHSQATSKSLDLANLSKYAKIKGINLLGTGDFTHPLWIKELKDNLTEDETGILKSKEGYPYLLQTELSLIYSQGGKGRRVHNIVFAPDFKAVDNITKWLLTKGRIDYDGRPIFKIPCPEFVQELKKIDDRIEIVPAHVWTPWFSVFGSKSGFDSMEECFQDMTKHIFAFETGLSSDPKMNWRLSALDKYTLLSNSDLHSYWPWRIGREANIFEFDEITYDNIIKALHTKQGMKGTIEVSPFYGKYHWDGHRKCNICFAPKETAKHNGICPVCNSPLTIGVDYRVEELADRPEGYKLDGAPDFHTLIPLSEVLSIVKGKAVATKTVWKEYDKLVNSERNEFDVLLYTPEDELRKITDPQLFEILMKNRRGEIKVKAGYDGEYGVPLIGDKVEEVKQENPVQHTPPKKYAKQKGLNEFFK